MSLAPDELEHPVGRTRLHLGNPSRILDSLVLNGFRVCVSHFTSLACLSGRIYLSMETVCDGCTAVLLYNPQTDWLTDSSPTLIPRFPSTCLSVCPFVVLKAWLLGWFLLFFSWLEVVGRFLSRASFLPSSLSLSLSLHSQEACQPSLFLFFLLLLLVPSSILPLCVCVSVCILLPDSSKES